MTALLSFVMGSLLWAVELAPSLVEGLAPDQVEGAAASRTPEPQDPDRVRISVGDFKALRENNVFAPYRARRPDPPKPPASQPSKPPPPPSAPRPRTPVVTGFVLEEQSGAFQVLVEDRNSDAKLKLFAQPRFLKAGEEFLGYTIESVSINTVSVKVGEEVRELRAGESFPANGGAVPVGVAVPAGAPVPEPARTAPSGEAGGGASSEGAGAAPAMDEDTLKKILEERKKRFQKKRDEEDFNPP